MAEVILEKYLSRGTISKAADVGLKTEAGWIALECQLDTKADLVTDLISRDFRAGFLKVVVCVVTRKDVEKVNAVVDEMLADPQFSDLGNLKEKVETKLLADFL